MELIALGPGFAAEVRGAGLADVAARDDVYAAVRAAFEEHSVLVFRNQPITDELQVAYSQRFGPLETAKAASLGEGTPFSILTNIDRATRRARAARSQGIAARARQPVVAYRQLVQGAAGARVGALRAHIPPVGGETEFTSMRRAWQRLPEALRTKLENSYAWHDYAHSRGKIAPQLASERERSTMPPVCWRMRWRNPVNGRDSLYVASHTCGIEGMARDEALALVDELIDDATRPEFTYLHRWQAGDVVMWDNRATLHRGRPWPDNLHPRHMVRTTISATDADGVAQLRPVHAAA